MIRSLPELSGIGNGGRNWLLVPHTAGHGGDNRYPEIMIPGVPPILGMAQLFVQPPFISVGFGLLGLQCYKQVFFSVVTSRDANGYKSK